MLKRLLIASTILVSAAITCAQDFSGFYYIYPRANAKFILDISGASKDDGAKTILWEYNGGQNQQFIVVPNGEGYFLIISRHSGKSLDVFGAKLDNGTPIIQFKAHGGENQLWKLIPAGGGYFYLQNKVSGKVLDAAGFNDPANQKAGCPVIQWDKNDGTNQQWRFLPVAQ